MRLLATMFALGFTIATAAPLLAQKPPQKPAPGEHTTVRHRKVAEVSPADTFTDQAEAALEKSDYAAAEPLLKQAVAADATHFRAWYDLGYLYDATNRAPDAIAAYRKAVALKPEVFEAQLHLGLTLADAGDPDAEKFLLAATHLKPETALAQNLARAWTALGRFYERKDPKAALAAYDKASEADPAQLTSRIIAAQLMEQLGDLPGAEQRYQVLLKLANASHGAPGSTAQAAQSDKVTEEALIGLANLYMRGKRLGDAESVLRQYLATHPEDAAAHVQLARVYAAQAAAINIPAPPPSPTPLFNAAPPKETPEQKQKLALNQQAAAEYESGFKLGGGDASSALELGSLYIAAGQLAEAEALYRRQLQAQPRDPDLHHLLGVVLLKQKHFADAQSELLAAVQLKPDLGAAWGDLASAAAENQQYELALKAMDERARYLPEIPIGYFLRASCLDHLHQRKEAAAAYHRFLETANGQYPDQEWAARHRIIALEPKK